MGYFSLKSILYYCLLITTGLGLSACSGGSDSNTPPAPTTTLTIIKGVFVDAVVSGVAYSTETQSGFTDANGNYDYVEGETVTFSIGGIVLGSATAGPVVTPLTLVSGATDATDPTVTNIVKLLLTLDADGNPDNGIEITSATTTAATGVTISFDVPVASFQTNTTVLALVSAANTTNTGLVDTTTAQTHFASTLASSWGVMAWGTTGQWSAN